MKPERDALPVDLAWRSMEAGTDAEAAEYRRTVHTRTDEAPAVVRVPGPDGALRDFVLRFGDR